MSEPRTRRYTAEELRDSSKLYGPNIAGMLLQAAEDAARLERIAWWASHQTITAYQDPFKAGVESGENDAKLRVVDLLNDPIA